MTGGLASPLQPLLYAFVALVPAVLLPRAAVPLAFAALALELLFLPSAPSTDRWAALLLHSGYLLLFAPGWWTLQRAAKAVQHLDHRLGAAAAQRRRESEERALRLDGSEEPQALEGAGEGAEDAAGLRRRLRDGVDQIRRAMSQQLRILRDAFGLHSCVLYWLDPETGGLRVVEASSGSDLLSERPVALGEGIVGTVASSGEAVALHGLRRDAPGILHYEKGERVAALAAVPVRDGARVAGVLLGDRRHDLPFSASNLAVFQAAGELIAATVNNERLFLEVERQRRDQEIFHHALKSLNPAQEAGAVREAVLRALSEVASFDLAALTLYDAETDTHRVVAVGGDDARCAPLVDAQFQGRGLVPQVVRTRHYLPVSGEVAEAAPAVFCESLRIKGIRSLLVLPLPYGEEVLGTLVLGSDARAAYGPSVRERLEVVAHSAAVSLKNAERFELIRTMATTDGLTGLVNHRQFQARYEEVMARARRSGSPFAVLLLDVDRFKAVNDTYGHPVGDEVLRAVAARLAETVRSVDLAARYGGEEFVALLENCGADGGMAMGERIREAIAGTPVPSAAGDLKVSVSVGVACYPEQGDSREVILEHADQALYAAKDGGRNQVRLYEAGK